MLALLVVVTAGLAASDVATYRALQTFLVERLDAQVDSLRDPVVQRMFRHGPDGVVPRLENGVGIYAEIRDSGGRVVETLQDTQLGSGPTAKPRLADTVAAPPSCGDAYCTSATPFQVPAESGSEQYRVHSWALPRSQGVLLIALPLRELTATLNQLLLTELLVSVAVLLGATLLGLYLVRVGLRPLDEIEATAGAIANGDLSQRVRRAEQRTEVGRLGLALNAMLGQIETAFAAKDASEGRLRRFLADASHELRSPLTSIRGYAELFRRGASERPDDLAKVLLRIEDESSRMGILVDDLLLLARLDQGRPLEREAIDLTLVADDAVDAARAVEPDRDIELDAPDTLVVDGDAQRLRQVFDNLLANVRTHTPRGAPAGVRLSASGDTAVIEVADSGPGIPDAAREQLFNRFFRADPARSRDHGGAGLGLSIVAAIVEAHGGTVVAGDREPSGAVFRVELPVSQAPPSSPQAGSKE